VRTLADEISPLALMVLTELLEKSGESRAELGKKLEGNIPIYKQMLKDRVAPATVKPKPPLKVETNAASAMKAADDLTGRSLHDLLVKKAGIPLAAMPWMKSVAKAKPKGRMVTMAPAGTPSKPPPAKTPPGHFATPGGAPNLSQSSIKATGQMVNNKLMRTKFK